MPFSSGSWLCYGIQRKVPLGDADSFAWNVPSDEEPEKRCATPTISGGPGGRPYWEAESWEGDLHNKGEGKIPLYMAVEELVKHGNLASAPGVNL